MRILIKYDNVYGQIAERLPAEVIAYIDDKTRYHPVGYDKTWNYKKKRWDGYNHCFDMFSQQFRVGIMERIVNALKFKGYEPYFEFTGDPTTHQAIRAILPEGVIRPIDFQQKIREVVRNNKRGIIVSPTGTGKTVMISLAVDEVKEQCLVILNDLVLLDQMARALGRRFPDAIIGYIGDSEFELGDITVATLNSLRVILGIEKRKNSKGEHQHRDKLVRWLSRTSMVVHDEAHLADAESCTTLYTHFRNVDRVYGFSATPYGWAEKTQKNGNIELEQIFGHVIYDTTGLDFISMNLKAPLIVKQVELEPAVKVYGTFRDNQAALYKKCLQFEITQNEEWAREVKAQRDEFTKGGSTCFIYASHSLEYGNKLAALLDVPFVQGKTPRKKRFEYFDALQDKKINCIVSDIGGVGLDIPSLDAFILASDSKDVRQMKGRVERACPEAGKQYGYFVDMWKNCSFLNKHHDLRVNQYIKDGNIIL